MSTVTNELQVTIPKEIADRYGIAPGGEIDFVPTGEVLRVVVSAPPPAEPVLPEAVERRRRAERWIEETRALIQSAAPDRDPADFGRDWTRARGA